MANPLKLLKLKTQGFQFIQEIPIDAPPAKVWKALLNVGVWFRFDNPELGHPNMKIEPHIGGRFMSEAKDESRLFGFVAHIEPNKLLRINGPMGMTHLPVSNVMIFQLDPMAGGKKTLLRFCQRAHGMMTPNMAKNYQGGWKQLFPRLKKLAEKK